MIWAGGFRAGLVAEHGGDVAELAIIGAAAGVLDAHAHVLIYINEIPQGRRGFGHIGELARAVEAFEAAGLEIFDECGDGGFGLVEQEMVDFGEEDVFAGEHGAAGDDAFAGGLAACRGLVGGVALDGHTTEEDAIGPGDVGIGEVADIHVDDAFGPFLRQHGGDGEQSQRRKEGLAAIDFDGVVEAPEAIGELGINQQDIHRGQHIFILAVMRLFFLVNLRFFFHRRAIYRCGGGYYSLGYGRSADTSVGRESQ